MLSLNIPIPLERKIPAWLTRIYVYVGAHSSPYRYENERDRAIQRIGMPVTSVIWILLFHHFVGTSLSADEYICFTGTTLYAASSGVFLAYLKRHPAGGVHAQYAFMAMDPLVASWALLAAPEALVWWQFLILVMIARVGLRYGLNAMKFELVFAWLGTGTVLIVSGYFHTHFLMAISLVVMLISTWWLFAPLNRSLERSKALDIQNAKLQSLRESLLAKSEFLSRVSHELRSPLQGVVSALELIEAPCDGATKPELISRIRRGTTSLQTQLEDLSTLGRGEVGKIEIRPVPFEMVELARTVALEAKREAWGKELELIVELPAEPIFVVADPGRIDQVMTNLVNNAIRHTERGVVTLKLEPYDEATRSLRFSVADTGAGIDPRRMSLLFEPFARFGELTTKSEGSGLGLAVVKSVLDFLGGTVHPESKLGLGTTFSVCIPAELLPEHGTLEPEGSKHRVLVVDDQQEVLEAIASAVIQLGYDCDTALSAGTAANLLGVHSYDVALIDLNMPIKTGRDLAAEIRRGKGPNRNTRLLSISAANPPAQEADSPFDGHLTKPITRLALQRAIELPSPAILASRSGAEG